MIGLLGHCEREIGALLIVSVDSIDGVERIRQTPSGESAGRGYERTSQRFQHNPVFINEQAASDPHTG
jgi:hypothetical protein